MTELLKNDSTVPYDGGCEKCGGPLRERAAHPYPLLLQSIFGISFILFLTFYSKFSDQKRILWSWTALQLVCGVFLIKARKKANKRILICIRCKAELT